MIAKGQVMDGEASEVAGDAPVTVAQFLAAGSTRLGLELVAGGKGLKRVIREPVLYRPGLALTGFYRHFAHRRIQVIGLAEHAYLSSLKVPDRQRCVARLLGARIPCLVFTHGQRVFPEVLRLAEERRIPVLVTRWETREFTHAGTLLAGELAAPRCKLHGTMLEVVGLGVLIEGPAGIGKSETALGLVERGHALVADDLIVVRRDNAGSLHGSAVEVTRHYMEIRGIGIVFVPALFGVAAVRGEKQLDLVVTLRPQAAGEEDLDRSGATDHRREVLGVSVPQRIILVAPGRDLVNIVETAALEYKSRLSGQVAYRDLDERIKRHHAGAGE
jgi:HPr kinase/phosphorylase